MRTKALLGLAVLAAGALTAAAQTSVYSLNVVGYYTLNVPAGKYALIANQMVGTNYTVANVLTVPDKTTLYKWSGLGYELNTYLADGGWDNPDMTLGPGEATFVKNNSTAAMNLTFVGEVNQATNTHSMAVGYKMVSLFTPQQGALQADFNYVPPTTGVTAVYQWSGLGYNISTYSVADGGWDPADPQVKVGEGFFIKASSAHTWTRSFTVQ